MKKNITLIVCLLLLTSCFSKVNETAKKDIYFLFATPLSEHELWLQAKEGFDDACEAKNIHCDWIGPTMIDTTEMDKVIETGVLQKADAIISQGVVSNEIIEFAKNAHIPIMLVDSDMPESERYAYLGKDFKQQAILLLADMEEKLGKDSFLKVGIQVAEYDFTIAKEQIRQLEDVLKEHPGGYEIVSISESKSDSVRSKNEWRNTLTTQPINVAMNFAGESIIGCGEVVKELGIKDQLLIYGVDDMPETITLLEQGAVDGSIVTSFYDYGYESVMWLYDEVVHQQSIALTINSVKLVLVTKKNVANYEEELK